MKVNTYVDASTFEKEGKKDYYDRHTPFVHCEANATKGEQFKVKVKMGNEYKHPDDFDHYIAWVQLWSGEKMLGQANFESGALGNEPGHAEVDFYIVPTKNMKLQATSYCTKHGFWQSQEVEVTVSE